MYANMHACMHVYRCDQTCVWLCQNASTHAVDVERKYVSLGVPGEISILENLPLSFSVGICICLLCVNAWKVWGMTLVLQLHARPRAPPMYGVAINTGRWSQRQTDRKTDRQTDRQTDKDMHIRTHLTSSSKGSNSLVNVRISADKVSRSKSCKGKTNHLNYTKSQFGWHDVMVNAEAYQAPRFWACIAI